MKFVQFLRKQQRPVLITAFLICIAALSAVGIYGINLGLEFTGGIEIEFSLEKPYDVAQLSAQLPFPKSSVNTYGSSTQYLMKVRQFEASDQDIITKEVQAFFARLNATGVIERVDIVGSEFSEGMADQAITALLAAFVAMAFYISVRFELRLAVSAILALMFDPIIILGSFAIFQWTFDAATLAGLLAVIGYSINDTIVVFDRVRENFQRLDVSSEDVFYISIEQTMSRTLITSLLTFMVVLSLLIFGTEVLRGFSTALAIGIVVGTCSSILIAGPLALLLGVKKEHLFPPDDPEDSVDEKLELKAIDSK